MQQKQEVSASETLERMRLVSERLRELRQLARKCSREGALADTIESEIEKLSREQDALNKARTDELRRERLFNAQTHTEIVTV